MRHRWYDPGMGQFLTRDPLGQWGDPLNLGHGTLFPGHDPVNFVDPYGLSGDCAAVYDSTLSGSIYNPFSNRAATLWRAAWPDIGPPKRYDTVGSSTASNAAITGALQTGIDSTQAYADAGGKVGGVIAESVARELTGTDAAFSALEAAQAASQGNYGGAAASALAIAPLVPGAAGKLGGNAGKLVDDIPYVRTTRDSDALDWRAGLDEAFKRTGVDRNEFTVTKWGKDQNGKSWPTEWKGPGGAEVSMDFPHIGTHGPSAPHIGWQQGGKRGSGGGRGHIFVPEVPAGRPPIGCEQ